MKHIKRLLFTGLILLFTASGAFAAISVVSVKGKVAYKDGGVWKSLSKGQTLAEGAKISTGMNSYAVLNIDGATVKIRPLSMIRVNKNTLKGDSSNTSLGLKYGSVSAKIPKLRKLKTVFKVSTPVATSSVRGTEFDVSYGPQWGMIIYVIDGNVYGIGNGIENLLSGNLQFNLKPGSPRPEYLLTKTKNGYIIKIYSDYMTPNEKKFHEFFGTDAFGNSEILPGGLNLKSNSFIKIRLIWPQ